MTYFIPSYFQKRLLRYALTRLDFINTDDLDLENLGLSFGQRSVVELKDVSIRISKLTERVQLPPYLVVRSATIRCLRLTVPADLHASGIEVEIEGIDISTQVRDDESAESNAATTRPRPGPSHTDQANRPRLSSPSTYDPGGADTGIHHGLETSHVLPTPEDLATSFLQSEPRAQREELEAAIGSQSQLYESTTSSSLGENTGLGMPAGFTLPTFVANFFQGIADRISVKLKDICILLEVSLSRSHDDVTRLCLKIGSVVIGSLDSPEKVATNPSSKRSVVVKDVLIGIQADDAVWSQPSSPKLRRSQSQLSSVSSLNSGMSRERAMAFHSTPASQHSQSSSDPDVMAGSVFFHPTVGLGFEEAPNDDNDLTPMNQSINSRYSNGSNTLHNKVHAEEEIGTLIPPAQTSSPESSRSSHNSEDLAESTLFSHEEAESMYMSAVSQGTGVQSSSRTMPGAWSDGPADIDNVEQQRRPIGPGPVAAVASSQFHDQYDVSTALLPDAQHQTSATRTVQSERNMLAETSLVRLLHVDYFYVNITTQASTAQPVFANQEKTASHAPSLQKMSPADAKSSIPYADSIFDLQAGDVSVDLDMRICKLAIRVVQSILKLLPGTTKQPQTLDTTSLKLRIESCSIKTISVHFRERLSPEVQLSSVHDSILSLHVSEILYTEELSGFGSLSILKIKIQHGAKDVLWFVDSVNVRDSIVSSSILRPHDMKVTIRERIEVQVKPVYAILDLIRIDDVLSRSGGLSSLLDLGSSIISTSTTTATATVASKPKVSTRSVRFSAPEPRPRSASDPSDPGPKINFRLSGSIIDFVGSQASIQIKTSAVKVVSRTGVARVIVDGAVIEGPILHRSKTSAAVYARIKTVELLYHETPDERALDRLITLITPSNDKFDDEDDIMVETLLRQRRKGGVIDLNAEDIQIGVRGIAWYRHISRLSEELVKLSNVAKYLPEDDRPGILTFVMLQKFDVQLHLDDAFGPLSLKTKLIEGAFISVPSLSAVRIDSWSLKRNKNDVLVGEVLPQELGAPMVMCRFIADEMEPTVRLKLTNNCLEYKVSTLLALTSLLDRLQQGRDAKSGSPPRLSPTSSSSSDSLKTSSRKIKVSVALRHTAIALHPTGCSAKGLFVFNESVIGYEITKKTPTISLNVARASLLVINNAETLGTDKNVDHKLYFDQNDQIQELARMGFVPVLSISAGQAVIKLLQNDVTADQQVDIEVMKNLMILETCADSTQTMIQVLSGLSPPSIPSKAAKYRTEIVPIDDMLASFTGNAYVSEPGPELGLDASQVSASSVSEQDEEDAGYLNDMYGDDEGADGDMTASYVESNLGQSTMIESMHIAPVNAIAPDEEAMAHDMSHSMLDFRDDHFNPKSAVGGTAHRWDSAKNTYGLGSETAFQKSPLKVRVRDMHVIWNMFDGYDWQSTRDTISAAVKDIETRAITKRSRGRATSPIDDEDEESVIGDMLFNSIYISIPTKQDPAELAKAINHDIDDQVSETSYATRTTVTASPSRRQSYRRTPTLRLTRSKQHKMSFELQGGMADVVAFPPGSGEIESSVDVRINKLEIFDNVPTSTWKKFATYMHDAGEREVDTSQVHVELLNVKPVAELAASEIVLKLTVLPLRLHVDQDALDFLSRFFEFKDECATSGAPSTPPFIQRVEVNPIRLRLDYKPKKVDYASLRSGRTTEFMNFIVLDRADMVLRRVILYGISGFDRMGIMLNDIWSPDVKKNQLAGVLSGLAPIRPIVDVGRGLNELITVPIREYRRDGRVVRAVTRGVGIAGLGLAREVANLGVKLAVGTQGVLMGAEDMLSPNQPQHEGDEEKKQISLYADQPVGIVQGLRGAYASLERDLLLARDAIVAVPGEVMQEPSAKGVVKAVGKWGPTVVLRPALGVSRAVGGVMQGVANTLDKGNLRRLEDKYKRH